MVLTLERDKTSAKSNRRRADKCHVWRVTGGGLDGLSDLDVPKLPRGATRGPVRVSVGPGLYRVKGDSGDEAWVLVLDGTAAPILLSEWQGRRVMTDPSRYIRDPGAIPPDEGEMSRRVGRAVVRYGTWHWICPCDERGEFRRGTDGKPAFLRPDHVTGKPRTSVYYLADGWYADRTVMRGPIGRFEVRDGRIVGQGGTGAVEADEYGCPVESQDARGDVPEPVAVSAPVPVQEPPDAGDCRTEGGETWIREPGSSDWYQVA